MEATVMEIGERVLAALAVAGYAEASMLEYREWIQRLELLARKQGGQYTVELGAEFASMTKSPRTGRFSDLRRKSYGRSVRVLDSCLLTGSMDLSRMRTDGGNPAPHCEEFLGLLAKWSEEMGQRNLALNTRNSYDRVARGFLVYLESQRVSSLQEAGATNVLGFLESLRGRWAESSMGVAVINLRAFLKFLGRQDLQDALGLANAQRRTGSLQSWATRTSRLLSEPAPVGSSRTGTRPSPCWCWWRACALAA